MVEAKAKELAVLRYKELHLNNKRLAKLDLRTQLDAENAVGIIKDQDLMKLQQHKHVIITGDQVVTCNNEILEKPKNKEELISFYQKYSNNYLETVGSIVMTNIETKQQVTKVDIARVTFKNIPIQVLEDICNNKIGSIEENEILFYCCGGLMIEHSILSTYIVSISSSMYSDSYIEGIDACSLNNDTITQFKFKFALKNKNK